MALHVGVDEAAQALQRHQLFFVFFWSYERDMTLRAGKTVTMFCVLFQVTWQDETENERQT